MKNRRILFEYLVWNLLQLSVYLNVIFEKRTFYVQVSIFKTILEMVCETVFRSVVLLLKVTFDTVHFFFFFFNIFERKPFSLDFRRIKIFSNSNEYRNRQWWWLFRDGMPIVYYFMQMSNIEISNCIDEQFPWEFSDGRVIIKVSELHS